MCLLVFEPKQHEASQRAVQLVPTEEGVGIGEKNALIARQSLFPPAGEGGRVCVCVREIDRR